jgi:mRNA interferase RelE/StbE
VYRLLLHPSIEKQLARVPKRYAQRLANVMRSLRDAPRPTGAKHLDKELYRIREGDFRIIYAVFDNEQVVFIGKIARRSERTYRDLAAVLSAARKALDNN